MPKTQNSYLPEDVLIPFFGLSPIVGAEIGILGASGSVSMLNRMPNLKLYCIDPWQHFDGAEYEAENPQDYHDQNYLHSLNRLAEFGDRAIILKMTSDAASEIVIERLDFVWIDGDHRYDQVKRDIQNWRPKLKERSIIGGHDYHLPHIQQAVYEMLGAVITGEDYTWWRING